MPKKTIILLIITCFANLAKAQTVKEVYDQYDHFNIARSQNDLKAAIAFGEKVLPNTDKLQPKARIYFYNSLAKAYEDNGNADKAIKYDEIVVAAEPNYYVAHRALGYFYTGFAKVLNDKMLAENPNSAQWQQDMAEYKKVVLKALPHLEKAQACDPSDETLSLIKLLYRNIKDDAGLRSLNARLAALSKNCVDLLSE